MNKKNEPVKKLAVSLFTVREPEKLLVELVRQVSTPKQDLRATSQPFDQLITPLEYWVHLFIKYWNQM